MLQKLGIVPHTPWGARGFSPAEIVRPAPADSAHPWAGRYRWRRSSGRPELVALRPALALRFNSTFPYGVNDGPVWAGRGLTSVVEAGLAAVYGPVSLTLAPLVFRAENRSFDMMDTGDTGRLVYADGFFVHEIDLPQRFGAAPYTVVDPGQSVLRVDAGGVAVGFSTANEYWGPAREYPILLGSNAAGFPHVFFGTAAPLNLGVVRVHARLLWGELAQSDYSPAPPALARRFGAGAVLSLTSRFVPGLEVGAGRFAHMPWRPGGPSLTDVLVPLGWQYRGNITGTLIDNQLAVAFFRWVLPRSGFETYGEYGRDDYNQNWRDLALEPGRRGQLFSQTGLGLTICRKLATALKSELKVESRTGWGTRFFFEVDLPIAAPRRSGPRAAPRVSGKHPVRNSGSHAPRTSGSHSGINGSSRTSGGHRRLS